MKMQVSEILKKQYLEEERQILENLKKKGLIEKYDYGVGYNDFYWFYIVYPVEEKFEEVWQMLDKDKRFQYCLLYPDHFDYCSVSTRHIKLQGKYYREYPVWWGYVSGF